MAWHDRDYNQENLGGFGGRRGGGGGALGRGFGGRSMVMWLLIINCVVFLLDQILSTGMRSQGISPTYWGNFNVEQGVYGWQVWRWFTYQFLHGGFFHILTNMIVLYFFGPMLEQYLGSKRFLAFYLLCGMCAAVVVTIITLTVPGLIYDMEALTFYEMSPTVATLVGASGSTFGILAGAAYKFPKEKINLIFPPISMLMRTLALFLLGLAALSVIVGADNAGGDVGHLGGALLGFVLMKYPRSLNWADRMSPSSIQDGVNKGRFERKKKREAASREEVNRILDKVREKGIASLTRKEKNTLNEETERQNRAG